MTRKRRVPDRGSEDIRTALVAIGLFVLGLLAGFTLTQALLLLISS